MEIGDTCSLNCHYAPFSHGCRCSACRKIADHGIAPSASSRAITSTWNHRGPVSSCWRLPVCRWKSVAFPLRKIHFGGQRIGFLQLAKKTEEKECSAPRRHRKTLDRSPRRQSIPSISLGFHKPDPILGIRLKGSQEDVSIPVAGRHGKMVTMYGSGPPEAAQVQLAITYLAEICRYIKVTVITWMALESLGKCAARIRTLAARVGSL